MEKTRYCLFLVYPSYTMGRKGQPIPHYKTFLNLGKSPQIIIAKQVLTSRLKPSTRLSGVIPMSSGDIDVGIGRKHPLFTFKNTTMYVQSSTQMGKKCAWPILQILGFSHKTSPMCLEKVFLCKYKKYMNKERIT